MIRLDLELDPQLVEFTWELIREALADLKQEPDDRFVPADPDDEDLAEAWTDSLREELDVDFQALTTLFTANRFGEESIELKPEAAEGILRACSSVRLWLRTRRLKDVTDESLEGGGRRPRDHGTRAPPCLLHLRAPGLSPGGTDRPPRRRVVSIQLVCHLGQFDVLDFTYF